jgi:proline iminopeptidase
VRQPGRQAGLRAARRTRLGLHARPPPLVDPAAYRIVLLDQRNCGRSTPHASDQATDLTANTTGHLIADLELLRAHLDIDRWLGFGLAYAQRHPGRSPSWSSTRWRPAGRRRSTCSPAAWAPFRDAAGEDDIVAGYARRLASPSEEERADAARAWCAWEDALGPSPRCADPRFRLAFARIVTRAAHCPCVSAPTERDLRGTVTAPSHDQPG